MNKPRWVPIVAVTASKADLRSNQFFFSKE